MNVDIHDGLTSIKAKNSYIALERQQEQQRHKGSEASKKGLNVSQVLQIAID